MGGEGGSAANSGAWGGLFVGMGVAFAGFMVGNGLRDIGSSLPHVGEATVRQGLSNTIKPISDKKLTVMAEDKVPSAEISKKP